MSKSINPKKINSKRIISYSGQEIARAEIELLPYQGQIHLSKKKINAFIGGTGSGKSWYAPIWLYSKMLEFPGHEWIVSGPTIPQMKRTIIRYIKKFCADYDVKYSFNKTDLQFDFGELGMVHCISAETPDRMQGIHAKGIIGDEAGMYDRLWFDTAIQRLSFKSGFLLLVITPYGLNWLYSEIYKKWLGGDDNIEFVNPTSIDNPFYPLDEYLEAKKRLPRWKFVMMYHAKFTRPAGLIYPRYTTVPRFNIPASWRTRYRALDWGFNNPAVILWFAQSPLTKKWYLYRELKQSCLDYDQIHKHLELESSMIIADPSEKGAIETLKRRGLPLMGAENAVMPGIISVQGAFKNEEIIIFDDLVYILDELSTYQWKKSKDSETILDQPVKVNDHCMDALRYFYFTIVFQGGAGIFYAGEDSKDIEEKVTDLINKDKTIEEIDNIFGDDDDD